MHCEGWRPWERCLRASSVRAFGQNPALWSRLSRLAERNPIAEKLMQTRAAGRWACTRIARGRCRSVHRGLRAGCPCPDESLQCFRSGAVPGAGAHARQHCHFPLFDRCRHGHGPRRRPRRDRAADEQVLKHSLPLAETNSANAALLALLNGYDRTSEPGYCPQGAKWSGTQCEPPRRRIAGARRRCGPRASCASARRWDPRPS